MEIRTITTSTMIVLEDLARKLKIKMMIIRIENKKILFECNIIIYLEIPKESTDFH